MFQSQSYPTGPGPTDIAVGQLDGQDDVDAVKTIADAGDARPENQS
jgi:hypothetical protein